MTGVDTIKTIQFKRGSKAALINYLVGPEHRLKPGEPAFEQDTGSLKIGNGVSDYVDLPYVGESAVGGEDPRFVIHDPEANQVLLYDSAAGKWVNKDLADDRSIIYLTDQGLTIKGYQEATQGQMLVKDISGGLAWIDPISDARLQEYVAAAETSKNQASNYATTAGNKAAEAETNAKLAQIINQETMKFVNEKFWWGTIEEYNALESINSGTFYFIKIGD